jgi:hypothetical protein
MQSAAAQPEDVPADQQQQSGDVDPKASQMFPSALQQFRRTMLYGATIVEGYVSANDTATVSDPTAIRTTSTWLRETFTAFRPFIAFNFYRGKTRLTLESAPIINYVPSRVVSFGINGFLDPRIGFEYELSPRLLLNFAGSVSYGDQLSQVLVLLPTDCGFPCQQRGAPAPETMMSSGGANAMSSLTPASSASQTFSAAEFAASGQVGLQWQRTRLQEFSLAVGKQYSTAPWEPASPSRSLASNVELARGQVTEHFTELVDLVAYSQIHQINFDGYACTETGGGLGYRQEYGRLTTWSIEAGPEYGNSGCHSRLGVSFSGAFERIITQKTAITFAAARGVDTFYVPGNNWVTSIEARIHHRTSDTTSFDVSSGYLQGSESFRPEAGYSGFFVTPRFLWKLADNVSLTTQYGHLSSTSGFASTFYRDWITLGLLWHPRPKNL